MMKRWRFRAAALLAVLTFVAIPALPAHAGAVNYHVGDMAMGSWKFSPLTYVTGGYMWINFDWASLKAQTRTASGTVLTSVTTANAMELEHDSPDGYSLRVWHQWNHTISGSPPSSHYAQLQYYN